MEHASYSPGRCPLCGADNTCAVAAGRPAQSCWCFDVKLSGAALAAIPEEAVNKYCICAACGQASPKSPDAR